MATAPGVQTSVLLCLVLSIPAGWFAGVLVDRIPDRLALLHPWPGLRPDRWQVSISAVTAACFAVLGWRFAEQPWGFLAAALLLVVGLIALAVIDIRIQRLPDRIVAPLYVVVLGVIVGSSLAIGEPARIRGALLGGLVWVLCLGVGWLIGMGFGDVKAGGVMGLYLGWLAPDLTQAVTLVLYALMIGVLIATAYGLVDRVSYVVRVPPAERDKRSRRWFALGPFLVAGAITVMLIYPSLTSRVI